MLNWLTGTAGYTAILGALVLAVIVVIAATAGLLMDQLTGSEWGIAVGAAMWWTTGAGAARESKGAL